MNWDGENHPLSYPGHTQSSVLSHLDVGYERAFRYFTVDTVRSNTVQNVHTILPITNAKASNSNLL